MWAERLPWFRELEEAQPRRDRHGQELAPGELLGNPGS